MFPRWAFPAGQRHGEALPPRWQCSCWGISMARAMVLPAWKPPLMICSPAAVDILPVHVVVIHVAVRHIFCTGQPGNSHFFTDHRLASSRPSLCSRTQKGETYSALLSVSLLAEASDLDSALDSELDSALDSGFDSDSALELPDVLDDADEELLVL